MRVEVLTYVIVLEVPDRDWVFAKDFADRKVMTGWRRLKNSNVAVGEILENGKADQVNRFGQPSQRMREQMAAEFDDPTEAQPA